MELSSTLGIAMPMSLVAARGSSMKSPMASSMETPMVLAIHGKMETEAIHAAHGWLTLGVGFAFLAGFAAATYQRGIDFVQVQPPLLALQELGAG